MARALRHLATAVRSPWTLALVTAALVGLSLSLRVELQQLAKMGARFPSMRVRPLIRPEGAERRVAQVVTEDCLRAGMAADDALPFKDCDAVAEL